MDSREKIDVGDWQDSHLPVVSKINSRRRGWRHALIGVLGTAVLHAALIQSVCVGGHRLKQRLPETRESAGTIQESATEPESLVVIAPATAAYAREALAQHWLASLPDLKTMKINSPIDIDPLASLGLAVLTLSEEGAASAAADGPNSAEQARLFGIYSGQIQARIERIWRKPRTPVSSNTENKSSINDSFRCNAQIIQDSTGVVQEILLVRCNGSAEWQRSLILAIQQASPLPAPPGENVFARSIVLQFLGLPYLAGDSEDEYELAPRSVAKAN